ncbi:MAG: DUF4038 domain-containing protein, partial [Bryobacter sp.]|nr:DUF4038 domain-containing protein [Bryobacter sp.]
MRWLWMVLAVPALVSAQPACPDTPLFTPCDLVYELSPEEAAAHPNPLLTVQLQAEVKSPKFRTHIAYAFPDGPRRLVIRFTPLDAGEYEFRVTSNIARWNGTQGKVNATASDRPGFVVPANVHHWKTIGDNKPHLWMGDTLYRLAWLPDDQFRAWLDKRLAQKFNHVRFLVLDSEKRDPAPFLSPDDPNPAYFQRLESRLKELGEKGIVADLILGSDQNHLAKLFPTWQQRERFIRYIASRLAPFNVTWQIVQEFEEYENGRALMKELGGLLKRFDSYNHPRTTHTVATSAPLLGDDWMTHILYQSSDDALGAIEHQLYAVPQVNSEFAYEDSGAGKTHPHHVDSETFLRRLWNSTFNGQYPTFGNTGTYWGRELPFKPEFLDSPGANYFKIWHEFMQSTRFWELEPYFDVDGGRALALERIFSEEDKEGIEYLVYVEKPRLIEVAVNRHGYDVYWFNPRTGEKLKQKDWKGDKFVGEPPTKEGPWILHLSRDGRKESMARSYYFESRRVLLQEVESVPAKVPFTMEAPPGDTISRKTPAKFEAKLTRQSRGTRTMLWLWTAEASIEGQGYRVVGAGPSGT